MDEYDDSGNPDRPLQTHVHAILTEEIEYLGSYATLAAYMRAMLEPEVSPVCAWILDHLDYQAVQHRWESDGSRLMIQDGHVYRLTVPGPLVPPITIS